MYMSDKLFEYLYKYVCVFLDIEREKNACVASDPHN